MVAVATLAKILSAKMFRYLRVQHGMPNTALPQQDSTQNHTQGTVRLRRRLLQSENTNRDQLQHEVPTQRR